MERIDIPDVEQVFERLILPFYAIKRDMLIPTERRNETDAEHSWSVGILACMMAPIIAPELDIGKIAQLGYVHDLVEIPAGDTSIWDQENVKTKSTREKQALEVLKKAYSGYEWLVENIEDYEEKLSAESKYIWAVDKLAAMTMRYLDCRDGGRYYVEIGLTKPDFFAGIGPTRQKARAHVVVGHLFDKMVTKVAEHDDWFAAESDQSSSCD
ncbi:MAG: HD domain-containing protein [Candidatus Saccharimonadales bacterium]